MEKRVTIILLCIIVAACTGRSTPAPVHTLSTKLASQNNLTQITGTSYRVKRGDTLFSIAFYSGNTYRDLAAWNNLSAPYEIFPNQNIRLTPQTNSIAKTKNNSTKVDLIRNSKVDESSREGYLNRQRVRQRQQNSESKPALNTDLVENWIWPASGVNRVATVGIDGTNRGLDIKGPIGSPILAAANGKVVYAGNALKGYGNLIIIKHNDEYLSAYAHNERILVSEQSFVLQGQQIATMGNTGASETMLHFEIRKRGQSMDPLQYLP
ncbi:peptidoglycan DD-metalloendopeptidase family protein [Glaciecola sp. 1036]|uniref:peptidoglycan DD-metalloendopeptidase family protein n=1 Tax=Alteromonadaceae TaxID=72275 RepID=UPI003CFEEB23